MGNNLQKRSQNSSSTTVLEEEKVQEINTMKSNRQKGKHMRGKSKRERELLTWDEIPDWQKDNEHILGGYIGETNSLKECLYSLFYLHNESVNVYTHLIPGVWFLTVLLFDKFAIKKFDTTRIIDYFMIDLFFFGAFTCLTLSSIFHCLKCHSLAVATFGNKLDYLGIVVLIVTSMVSILYYGFFESSWLFYTFTLVTLSFGAACAVVSLGDTFRTREWRPYRAALFVAFGLSAVLPIFAGVLYFGFTETYERIQLKWVVLGGIFYILGAFLYGIRFPERLAPGKFDIWGHSHQLFHLLVVIAALCHLCGVVKSYELVHLKLATNAGH
ncbi:hypothetical protein HG535_0G02880 [Zygotorulaspora mrakii]|uniref:Uncharacterized protein n=1 Tax=Zygotorulaspora mrakii TaxID=42260 RepID=A0A7H9B6Q3_ZYGMR|nr:uncharacterized protein HG535_0G02880 [Zygotorulaspora mrakii]QLG74405.1 hypothetical protein HG535_0G02880 [Zygotorulaspora mrakii]